MYKPQFNTVEINSYLTSLHSNPADALAHIRGEGFVKLFELKLAEYYKRKYCISTSSGTIACTIVAMYLAQQTNSDAKVAVSPFNYPSSISGLKYFFKNNNIGYMQNKPDSFDVEVPKGDEVAVFWLADFGGLPINIDELADVFPNAVFVLDACQSFGSKIDRKPSHPKADIIIQSFTSGKPICTFEGGAIITDDKKLYEFALQSWHPERVILETSGNEIDYPIINCRLNPLASIIGINQLEVFQDKCRDHRLAYRKLKSEINKVFSNRIRFIKSTSKQKVLPNYFELYSQVPKNLSVSFINQWLQSNNLKFYVEEIAPSWVSLSAEPPKLWRFHIIW